MFTGFSQQTIDFLWGIRFNNERSWFEANKETYLNELHRPMQALADEMLEFLDGKRPKAGLVRRVTRIYRDARRNHSGRGPYKDELWFSIEQPSEMWVDKPSFIFFLTADRWGYGLGDYALPGTMAKLRARMDRDPKPMEKLVRQLARQEEFSLELSQYKKPKAPAPSKLLEPWYKAKSFDVFHYGTPEGELFSRDLVERMKEGYTALLPWFDYFSTLAADPDPNAQ